MAPARDSEGASLSDPRGGLEVAHFHRRPLPGASFSAETIFATVRSHLPAGIRADRLVAPHESTGVVPRIRNTIWASRHASQVNHITGDIHYVALGLPGGRTILTVLDCVFLTNPSALRRALIKLLWYRLPIHRVAAVTVISDFTRRQLADVVPSSVDKVHVIPACVSPTFRPLARTAMSLRPVVLQVGTPPNKNIERLAAALEGIDCQLHVVGNLSESQRAALIRHRIDYANSIGLSESDLLQAYAACDILSFCSTYEGFGMPIVEAQLVGRPVVTSNVTSMPEIAGDAAHFVDPLDVRSIRAGITRVLADRDYRDALVARGRVNAARFSPERIAAAFAALYFDIADRSHA